MPNDRNKRRLLTPEEKMRILRGVSYDTEFEPMSLGEEEESELTPRGTAGRIAGMASRLGGGVISGIVGAIPTPANAAAAATIAGGSEALAQKLEREGPINWNRVMLEGGLGAIPLGWIYKVGKPLASNVARGAAFAELGTLLRRQEETGSMAPQDAGDLLWDIASIGLGGGTGLLTRRGVKGKLETDPTTGGASRKRVTKLPDGTLVNEKGEVVPPRSSVVDKETGTRGFRPTEGELKELGLTAKPFVEPSMVEPIVAENIMQRKLAPQGLMLARTEAKLAKQAAEAATVRPKMPSLDPKPLPTTPITRAIARSAPDVKPGRTAGGLEFETKAVPTPQVTMESPIGGRFAVTDPEAASRVKPSTPTSPRPRFGPGEGPSEATQAAMRGLEKAADSPRRIAARKLRLSERDKTLAQQAKNEKLEQQTRAAQEAAKEKAAQLAEAEARIKELLDSGTVKEGPRVVTDATVKVPTASGSKVLRKSYVEKLAEEGDEGGKAPSKAPTTPPAPKAPPTSFVPEDPAIIAATNFTHKEDAYYALGRSGKKGRVVQAGTRGKWRVVFDETPPQMDVPQLPPDVMGETGAAAARLQPKPTGGAAPEKPITTKPPEEPPPALVMPKTPKGPKGGAPAAGAKAEVPTVDKSQPIGAKFAIVSKSKDGKIEILVGDNEAELSSVYNGWKNTPSIIKTGSAKLNKGMTQERLEAMAAKQFGADRSQVTFRRRAVEAGPPATPPPTPEPPPAAAPVAAPKAPKSPKGGAGAQAAIPETPSGVGSRSSGNSAVDARLRRQHAREAAKAQKTTDSLAEADRQLAARAGVKDASEIQPYREGLSKKYIETGEGPVGKTKAPETPKVTDADVAEEVSKWTNAELTQALTRYAKKDPKMLQIVKQEIAKRTGSASTKVQAQAVKEAEEIAKGKAPKKAKAVTKAEEPPAKPMTQADGGEELYIVFRPTSKRGVSQYVESVDETGPSWNNAPGKAAKLTRAQVAKVVATSDEKGLDIRTADYSRKIDPAEVKGYVGQDADDNAIYDAAKAWDKPKEIPKPKLVKKPEAEKPAVAPEDLAAKHPVGSTVEAYGSTGEVLTHGPFGVRVRFTAGKMVKEQGANGYFDVDPRHINSTTVPAKPAPTKPTVPVVQKAVEPTPAAPTKAAEPFNAPKIVEAKPNVEAKATAPAKAAEEAVEEPAILTRARKRMAAGESLTKTIDHEWFRASTEAERKAFEDWLVKTKHPAAMEAGSPQQRFWQVLKESAPEPKAAAAEKAPFNPVEAVRKLEDYDLKRIAQGKKVTLSNTRMVDDEIVALAKEEIKRRATVAKEMAKGNVSRVRLDLAGAKTGEDVKTKLVEQLKKYSQTVKEADEAAGVSATGVRTVPDVAPMTVEIPNGPTITVTKDSVNNLIERVEKSGVDTWNSVVGKSKKPKVAPETETNWGTTQKPTLAKESDAEVFGVTPTITERANVVGPAAAKEDFVPKNALSIRATTIDQVPNTAKFAIFSKDAAGKGRLLIAEKEGQLEGIADQWREQGLKVASGERLEKTPWSEALSNVAKNQELDPNDIKIGVVGVDKTPIAPIVQKPAPAKAIPEPTKTTANDGGRKVKGGLKVSGELKPEDVTVRRVPSDTSKPVEGWEVMVKGESKGRFEHRKAAEDMAHGLRPEAAVPRTIAEAAEAEVAAAKRYGDLKDAVAAGKASADELRAAGEALGRAKAAIAKKATELLEQNPKAKPEVKKALERLKNATRLKTDPDSSDELMKLAPEEQMSRLTEIVNKFIKSGKGFKSNKEAGLALNEALVAAGLSTAGAFAGMAMRPDDPVTGALLGLSAGGAVFAPHAIRALIKHVNQNPNLTPAARQQSKLDIAKKIKEIRETSTWMMLPELYRASLLTSTNLPVNAVVGPYGSALMYATEHALAGDPRGLRALRMAEVNPTKFFKQFLGSWSEAKQRIASTQERTEGMVGQVGPAWFRATTSAPAEVLTSGDIAARNWLKKAGFTEAEARQATLTSEPVSSLGVGIGNLRRSKTAGGKSSMLWHMLIPFYRTNANQVEQGLMRLPGVGNKFRKAWTGKSAPARLAAAQQMIMTAATTSAFLLGTQVDESDNPWLTRMMTKIVNNFGGPYGSFMSLGFAAGMAHAKGKDPVMTAAQRFLRYDMPMPSTDSLFDVLRMYKDLKEGKIPEPPTGLPFPPGKKDAEILYEWITTGKYDVKKHYPNVPGAGVPKAQRLIKAHLDRINKAIKEATPEPEEEE